MFGAAIEFLQTFVQRGASLNDIYSDILGIVAGICLHAAVVLKNIHYKKFAAALLVASLGFLLIGISPLLRLSWCYIERLNAFPVILDINASWSSCFIRHNDGAYPGISIIETEPDWSGYEVLRFSVRSASEHDLTFGLRIHDRVHNQEHFDRFNMKLLIKPGDNEYQIPVDIIRQAPADRELDMKNISSIGFFSKKSVEWRQVQVGDFYLE